MKAYHVIAKESGWSVEITPQVYITDNSHDSVFKTKKLAVLEARKNSMTAKLPIIIHSRDGRVVSVSNKFQKIGGRKVFSANVKRTFNSKNLRNTIASVIYENPDNNKNEQ